MIGFQEDILVGLRNKGVPVKYIKIIKARMRDAKGSITNVKTAGRMPCKFPITIGLHQGLALSPYLYTLAN